MPKKNSKPTLTSRVAQAELLAKAAQHQKVLAKAELKASRKTFKHAKKIAKKALKHARRAVAEARKARAKR